MYLGKRKEVNLFSQWEDEAIEEECVSFWWMFIRREHIHLGI
jgi:hypothetical protein